MINYYPHHQCFYDFDLISLLWNILIIWLIVFVLYRLFKNKPSDSDSESNSDNYHTPLEILKRRYARGKITKKEFESMKKDIA